METEAEVNVQCVAGPTETTETGPKNDAVLHFHYRNSAVGKHSAPGQATAVVPSRHDQILARLSGAGTPPGCQAHIVHRAVAEAVGTGMLVIFGCGSVCVATLSGAQVGLWQVAVIWGFGLTLAIYSTASVSGAHLNPAVSLAFALLRPRDFAFRDFAPYCFAQVLGGVLGGALNLAVFDGPFRAYEETWNFSRGDPASVLTAACFGEYFPNPGFQYASANSTELVPGSLGWTYDTISPGAAFCIEAWGTAILAFVIFALTDSRNTALVRKDMAPFFIGFTVASLISLYAPLTQAGWNPARDFGPRLVAAMAGWGSIAIPGPQDGFWVYIVGPMIGAPLGAAFYEFVVARGLEAKEA